MIAVARDAARIGRGRVRRRQRQPDGAGPHERADGVDRDPARGGDRDDPARHAARHDGDGARGRAARGARGRRSQRPRGDRRPAARRRLSGLARRLRDRLDRARAAARPGSTQGVDYVGKAIDRPTAFFIGVAVNPSADDLELELRAVRAQGRGGRAVRDDAGALRPRRARALPRAARRLVADPAARRRLAAAVARDGAAPAQRGAGDLGSRARARRAARCRLRRAGGRARARPRAARVAARPRRRGLRDPAVQAAGGGARPACSP